MSGSSAAQHLHFVGIGGSGMSGLARMCRARGYAVSGSEREDSDAVAALRAEGFEVVIGQTAASVPASADELVISAAIPLDHPEALEAGRRGLPVVKYAAMLGRLMGRAGTVGLAVAGTHGKSSTTSMLGHVLISAGADPSVIVGAVCPQIGGGMRVGGGAALVAEACEYDRSFHALCPTHAAILNIEADHLDIYRSLDEVVESFAVFARKLPSAGGSLLIQHESPHRVAVTAGLSCKVETIGFAPQADWGVEVSGVGFRVSDVPASERGSAADHGRRATDHATDPRPRVTLRHQGGAVASWCCPLPGEHMAYNSAAAAVLAHRAGASWDAIASALESFEGLNRRMQRIGVVDGVTIIDDYAHHPTEVDTTLRALRAHHRPSRIICVFQPHQHSRTRFLMEQFAVSFGGADVVIVPEIYFVRDSEQERMAVTAARLVERLRAKGVTAMHVHPLDAIAESLRAMCRPGDLVVTMGAGDVWKVGRSLAGA